MKNFSYEPYEFDNLNSYLIKKIDCTYFDLVNKFGEPNIEDNNGKKNSWNIKVTDNDFEEEDSNYQDIISIYPKDILIENGCNINNINQWHIGGKQKLLVNLFINKIFKGNKNKKDNETIFNR